jgi:DNA-binding response OmpR family regulator
MAALQCPLYSDEIFLCDRPSSLNSSPFNFDCSKGPVAEPFSTLCGEVGELPDDLSGRIRFVAIGNQISSPLGNYVRAVFGPVDIHRVTLEDLRGFSSQLGSYAVLVVLTDDVQRAKRKLRKVHALTENKLVYAMMTESTPQARAALMRLSVDDVFDLRTRRQEILVRIGSHWQRQQEYDLKTKGEARFTMFCEENLIGTVHSLQVPVLKRLFDNLGEVVRYRDLAAYDFHSGEFRTDSLTVRIHHLRRKLKNYEIRCKRGVGYVLVKLDEEGELPPAASAGT